MVDPQPTLVELLVRHVLLPRELLPQIEINSNEEQTLFRCRKRTVLVHREPAGGPRFPIEAPRRQMRLVRGFKRRDQLLKLVEGQTGEIQELGGARLHIGES